MPVGVFLGEPGPYNQPPERQKLVLSLEALRSIDPAEPVQRFVHSIIEARGDFNGKVLSLRHDDLKALCVLVGGDIPTGVAQLRAWGVLLEGPVRRRARGSASSPADPDRRAARLTGPGERSPRKRTGRGNGPPVA